MRDIRDDLKERLEAVRSDITRLKNREASLMQLIESEELEVNRDQAHLFAQATDDSNVENPIRNFVLGALKNGNVWTVDELKSWADETGFEIVSANPGRSLNITLVTLQRIGLAGKDEDGWHLIEGEEESGPPKTSPCE